MKHFAWNEEKNQILKETRNLSFEELVLLIDSDQLLAVEAHPSRENQRLYIVRVDDYAVVIPFVESEDEIFLKSAFPSRKYTKRFGLR